MDFTFKTYEKLLNSLLSRGFSFLTFTEYIEAKTEAELKMDSSSQPMSRAESRDQPHPNSPSTSPLTSSQPSSKPECRKTRNLEFQSFSGIHDRRSGPQTPNTEHQTPQQINKEQINNFESLNFESLNYIILRHDVEARYANALRMAHIEHRFGIKGSYYFRFSPKAGNEAIIKEITALGHEIGYHYDDLTVCKGDHQKALERFKKNLDYLRQFAPVRTITMEGAPLSIFDNRDLWKQTPTQQTLDSLNIESLNSESINPLSTVHYSLFSIIAEPYFDLNFNQIFYLTDTGRCWDGHRYNLRDKATKENPVTNPYFLKLRYHTTFDLINAIEATFPQQINKEQINEFSNPESLNFESLNFESFPPHAMLNFHPQRWNDKPLPWLKELLFQNIKNQGKRLLLHVRKSQ